MIVCPNCNHQNPDGAVQCEACYTPLPALTRCPSCGAAVQSDASFCGQCGFDLRSLNQEANGGQAAPDPDFEATYTGEETAEIPDLIPPDPLVMPDPITAEAVEPTVGQAMPSPGISAPVTAEASPPAPPSPPTAALGVTQIQVNQAKLLHVQTNTLIELPPELNIVHLGKPNDRIPPTIDVSGFPNSEIVSRMHADIRVEGDVYYIEDVGSSNGTYINNMPLPPGNRHRLRPGDRIALGKGDKVTFIFQSA